MNEVRMHQVLMLFYAAIVLCFTESHAAVRPKTPTTFHVTEGTVAEIPCWIGNNPGAMWFYQFENLLGREESYIENEHLILKILSVRPTDTGSYICVSNVQRSLVRLIVIDLGVPRVVRAKALGPTQIKVSWAAPRKSTEAVAGYKIYAIKQEGAFKRTKEYRIDEASQTMKESIVLDDMDPSTQYEIKLSALYFDGADEKGRTEGPLTSGKFVILPDLPLQDINNTSADDNKTSADIPGSTNHSTPNADSDKIFISFVIPKPIEEETTGDLKDLVKPKNLLVVPDGDSRLVVTWQIPVSPRPRELLGYNVAFQPKASKGKKKKNRRLPASGEMNVTNPVDSSAMGSSWRVVISFLKPNFQYVVTVSSILPNGFGPPATPVTALLEGAKLPALQLSMRVVPLAPDSVLVTFRIQGKKRIPKIKLSIMEEHGTEWKKVKVTFKENKKLIKGLKPKTTYYFYATAKLGGSKKEAVTHVLTPPSDLSSPTGLTLTPGDNGTVLVQWRHLDDGGVLSYRLTVEKMQQNGSFSVQQDNTADVETKSAEIMGLHRDSDYRVKVTPYDLHGRGQASEISFHIAADGSIDNEGETSASPPEFETELPEQINVTRGGRLEIACAATGTPSPQVSWYVNNAASPTGAASIGHQDLVVDPVDEPLGVICVAKNSAGTIFAPVRVTILEEPEAETSKPEFQSQMPRQLIVEKGGVLKIPCVATGTPTPEVLWYVNDATEPTEAAGMGRNDLFISPVDGPLGVICVANNSAGAIFAPVRVSLFEKPSEDPIEPLQFKSDLPEMLPVTSGGNVTINCSAAGSPKPKIRWYKNDELMAQAGPDELFALFHEVDITANFSVTCVVYNDLHLISAKIDIISQEPELISVEAYLVPVSESEVFVNWIVTQGDLDAIRGFNGTLYDQDNKQLVVVPLASNERSLPLDNFNPNASFKFVLQTLTSEGAVDEDLLDLVFLAPDPGSETKLHVDVVEVRENQARVNLRVTGPESNLVGFYRIQVNQLKPLQNVLILTVDAGISSQLVQDLRPHSQYELIVSAISEDAVPVVNDTLRFSTSSPGRSGSQVLSGLTTAEMGDREEETCPQCPVCTTPPVPTCACVDQTNATSASSLSTEATTVVTTMEPDVSSLTPVVTTLEPDVSSLTPVITTSTLAPETTVDDQTFLLTMRLLAKSPKGMKLAWVVEQGNLEHVHSFLFKLSTGSGRKLVESKVPRKARTLSLTSLRPNSAYIVNIKARDIDGEVLAEAKLPVKTSSTDASTGPSQPKLYLEASEIRNGQLRLIWAVQDMGSLKVSSFRLRVLNGDFGESELLNRKILPNRTNFLIQRIPSNRHISIIMEAMGADNQSVLTSGLTIDTPASGAAGKAVVGSPLAP